MATRKKVPVEIEGDVIYMTDYKCCVCQDGTKGVHIHHIDENKNNYILDLLRKVCLRQRRDSF